MNDGDDKNITSGIAELEEEPGVGSQGASEGQPEGDTRSDNAGDDAGGGAAPGSSSSGDPGEVAGASGDSGEVGTNGEGSGSSSSNATYEGVTADGFQDFQTMLTNYLDVLMVTQTIVVVALFACLGAQAVSTFVSSMKGRY